MSIDPKFVSTGFEFPGYRITKTLGVVRGIVVRSRSIIGTVGASLQTLLGGQYHALHRHVRARSSRRPSADDRPRGAISRQRNLGVRYDANEITAGVTEVLAYGTAVYVEISRN